MSKAVAARLRAELAAALHRREELQHRWAVASYTASGGDPSALDVALAAAEATIAELEERLAALESPAPAAVDLAARAANDSSAPALPAPEYVGTRDAAALLGISPRTLEGLRLRGEGPPHIRIGRRVLYPLASLRAGK